MKEDVMDQNLTESFPKIKVFGFGGCGCNSVANLKDILPDQIELVALNTDFFSLSRINTQKKIRLGENTCKGLGTGGDVNLGKLAAEESFREIIREMQDASLIFLTAGLGGGTGSGAIEIGARIAKSLDIPTISFVTMPFGFETEKRRTVAYESAIHLQPFTETLITVPNDKMLSPAEKSLSLEAALRMPDSLLSNYILGLIDLISCNDTMHIDLSYILAAFHATAGVYITRGSAAGPQRIQSSIEQALHHPMLEGEHIQNAQNVVIKFTGDIDSQEIDQAFDILRDAVSEHAEIMPIVASGTEANRSNLNVSILLTGLGATPVAVPEIWLSDGSSVSHLEDGSSLVDISIAEDASYEDTLEVPAFIRRGYNLGKRLKNDGSG